jgi:formylglycine-generating enzyme required for sulfatase activity
VNYRAFQTSFVRIKTQAIIMIVWFSLVCMATSPVFARPDSNLNDACFGKALQALVNHGASSSRKIENLDDMLRAFSEGLSPDLSNKSQRDAFEIYRRMRFGNPNTSLHANTVDEVAQVLKKHPELEKEAFRDFKLVQQERIYPVTKELSAYLDPQVVNAAQIRSNLFQVDANSGYWKKIFQYEEVQVSKVQQLTREASLEQRLAFREAAKREKELATKKWMTFLDVKLPQTLRQSLLDPTKSASNRAGELYRALAKERANLIAQRKDIKPISQAMVDVIHTIGYHDPVVIKAMKSSSGLERLNGYRKVLDERDRFAMELGFHDHFEQVLKEIAKPSGITLPTGVPVGNAAQTLARLEVEVLKNSKIVESSSSALTIRHLSLVESPFRSCLGGSDCSSRTYLTRALDPNYHYFTVTDEAGFSSGHITVVLGEGSLQGKPVKMAFVDKVQNVPNTELPQVMEGVRRSVEERGYKLAVPDDVGNHNGLSNEDITRSFVEKNIKKNLNEPILQFRPHPHSYQFPNTYSRAEAQLPSHAVSPLVLSKDIQMIPGEIAAPWKVGNLNLDELVQASIKLKNSSKLEDRLRYIPSMKAIQSAKLKVDPEFESTISRWMGSPHEPIQLRKQALLYQWTENSKPLSELLSPFDDNHQAQLLQNLMGTPRYRDLILKDKNGILDLILMVRKSKKVRDSLLGYYAQDRMKPLMNRVLDAQDIVSNANVSALIKQIKASMESIEVESLLAIPKLAQGTSVANALQDDILLVFASQFDREASLGRALSKCLNSQDPLMTSFGRKFLARVGDPQFKNQFKGFKIIKAFQEIEILKNQNSKLRDFTDAAKTWMQSGKVDAELKASFLLSSFGQKNALGENLYLAYRKIVPSPQFAIVQRKIDEMTNVRVFERLASKEGNIASSPTLKAFLENGKLESFEYRVHEFAPGGKRVRLGSPADEVGRGEGEDLVDVTLTKPFEMQATPVTQLQWSLVMGENPSYFRKDGQVLKINGNAINMHPNRPVEQVSWNDAQKFIAKLNEMDPRYNYRLPTEAEWEYATRAGTDTPYFFGSDPNDLDDYGWYWDNSGSQTHDVASLKPNAQGLYDMHGNVTELVQDCWSATRSSNVVDPVCSTLGNVRVVRGGSWYSSSPFLRSATRHYYLSDHSSSYVGFRLVRTPK